MKKIILLSVLYCFVIQLFAQSNDTISVSSATSDSVYLWSTERPILRTDIAEFLSKNIYYPLYAQKKRIEGRVLIEFIIEKDGSISNIKTLKAIGGDCDKEAERVITLTSGLWTPGKHYGKEVRCKMIQPILFSLTTKGFNSNIK